ncbi:hypothetical protein MNBD_ACTINO02-1208 [hydrothermal vent metagenome]|uniref:Rad50/SbcC-type AAA domain-containing protein n=1 Tax=hydrothermal vent metagenome TaxID=652676 RepID=A0A3B0T0D8_9ZZZZ
MRIRRIKVHNYAGITEAEVSFPNEGITIVQGPNEAGKTSLIEAVDLILDLQDSSNHRRVKEVIPVGKDVGPEVEIDMTAGVYEFTYSKRWKRSPETVLEISQPAREQLTGRDAHDRVQEIINEAVDVPLWEALHLVQGDGLAQANFEVSSLGRALDLAAGGDVAGDREEGLWDRINAEREKYWTPGGKPKSTLSEAQQAAEDAQADVEAAEAHLRELDKLAEKISELELAAHDLRIAAAKAADDVEVLAGRVEVTERIRRRVTAAQQELDRALLVRQGAQEASARRNDLVTTAAKAHQELEAVTAEIERSAPLGASTQDRAKKAKVALAEARAAFVRAQQTFERARADSEYYRHRIGTELLTERLDRIKVAQPRLTLATRTLESTKIDAELFTSIEAAYLALARAQAADDQTSPSVVLAAPQEVQLLIDDEVVTLVADESQRFAVRDTTRIVLPDVLEVSVSASGERTDLAERVETARTHYVNLCREAGASDVVDARRLLDARNTAERDQQEARATIRQDLRDLTVEELSDKLEQHVIFTSAYEENHGTELPLPPNDSKAKEPEDAAASVLNDAKTALEQAEAAAEMALEEAKEFDITGAGLTARLEIARATAESADLALLQARQETDDERVSEIKEAADTALTKAKAAAESTLAELNAVDPDTLDALLTNANNTLTRAGNDLQSNRNLSRELQIQLRHDTERGPAREHDEAKTRFERASSELQRLTDRAAAAELLHKVFTEHRQQARHRYAKPFRDQIESLGRIAYEGGFEITLDDNLSVATRTLDGTTLAFEQLSTGAQEQLGLLARLACATLVAPEGGAPVIFDDALGWTDPQRLAHMGAAISTVADSCQVIILTCVPGRYAAVGNARTVNI